MKQIFNTLILVFLAWNIQAQHWQQKINLMPVPPPNFETKLTGYDVQETSDGNYVFAGNFKSGVSPNFSYAPTLIKLNASTGALMWTKAYSVFNGGYMQEVSLIEKPNGNLLLAGLENNSVFLIETDAAGDTISTQSILSTCDMVFGGGCNAATIRIRATLDGNYILGLGSYGGMIGMPQPINQLIKISPSNTIIWNKNYYGRFIRDFQPTSDGGFVMSGATSVSTPMIYKVDMNGDSLWQQEYGGQLIENLNSIKETPDNGFVIACDISGFAGYSPFLLKVDSNAANIIFNTPLGGNTGNARHVIVDGNGNYIVTGERITFQGGPLPVQINVAFVSKVSAAGFMLQDQVFDNTIDNSGWAVRYTSDGNFVMVGTSSTLGDSQNLGYAVKTGYYLNTIEVEEQRANIQISPNPFQDQTTLSVEGGHYENLQVQIFDALGRQVQVAASKDLSKIIIERKNLATGIYFFKVLGDGQAIGSGKVVID